MAKIEINILYNGRQNKDYAEGFISVVNHLTFDIIYGKNYVDFSRGQDRIPYNLLNITNVNARNLIESKFGRGFDFDICKASILVSLVDDAGNHNLLINKTSCHERIRFRSSSDTFTLPDNPFTLYPTLHHNLVERIKTLIATVAAPPPDDDTEDDDDQLPPKSEAGFGKIGFILFLIYLGTQLNKES